MNRTNQNELIFHVNDLGNESCIKFYWESLVNKGRDHLQICEDVPDITGKNLHTRLFLNLT